MPKIFILEVQGRVSGEFAEDQLLNTRHRHLQQLAIQDHLRSNCESGLKREVCVHAFFSDEYYVMAMI
jgi:hypothetical protein